MTADEYTQLMSHEYLSVCHNKSVLEIGPYYGWHTKMISEQNPKNLVLIEPDERCQKELRLINGIDKIINDDVFFILNNKYPVDVVVCCGLLYHIHSPLYLLELITNNCQPEFIILDCVSDQKKLAFLKEQDNEPGNRQTQSNWLSAGFNLVIPFEIIAQALENMGYVKIKQYNFTEPVIFKNLSNFKNNFWLGLWKKI